MTAERSHDNLEVGQQLYALLESVKQPESLWAKLATGNYDWLGVRRNGRYVIGRPRLSRISRNDSQASPNKVQDRHRIEYLAPLDRSPRWEAYATAEEARSAYARVATGDPITPLRNSGVWRVRLVIDDESNEAILVVRALPRIV
jgi:hypothetical protein